MDGNNLLDVEENPKTKEMKKTKQIEKQRLKNQLVCVEVFLSDLI